MICLCDRSFHDVLNMKDAALRETIIADSPLTNKNDWPGRLVGHDDKHNVDRDDYDDEHVDDDHNDDANDYGHDSDDDFDHDNNDD